MKKLLFIIAATFFSMTAIAFAAPVSNIYRSIVPEADNTYYIGTTTPSSLQYKGIYTKDLTVTGTCTGCGSSASYPFTPTTNYNVAVNSTSTPIWFTAGLMASSTSYFPGSGIWNSSGRVGIGTTTLDIAGTTLDTLVIGTASAINAGIVLDLGAAGTGAYGFAIDGTINSRISYSAASKAMSFLANSLTAQMTLVSSGNVGIGITAPENTLQISTTSAGIVTNGLLLQNRSSTIGTGVSLNFISSATSFSDNRYNSITSVNTDGSNGQALTFSTSNSAPQVERMRITSTGNVGIGTSTPGTLLTVSGVANFGLLHLVSSNANGESGLLIKSADDANGGIGTWRLGKNIALTSDAFELYNGSTGNVLTALTSGNVGIGTTTPGQKLSVAGDILGNNIIGSYFTSTSTTASTFAGRITSTATAANTFPYASTTAISASGQFFGNAADFVTTPSYSWGGDTTTGIYRSTTSQVGIAGAGLQLANFKAGTTTLNIYATNGTLGEIRLGRVDSTVRYNTIKSMVGTVATDNFIDFNLHNLVAGVDYSSVNSILMLNGDGRVGISSSTPLAKLSVHANANDGAISRNLFLIASSTATATTTLFSVSNTGAVGIGTTTPGQKLSVAGDILGNNIIGSYFTSTSTTASTFVGAITSASYLRVGSNSAPNNTTAGDITGTRLSIGNTAISTVGQYLNALGTLTGTSGTLEAASYVSVFTPTGASTAQMRGLGVTSVYTGANDMALGYGSYYTNNFRASGSVSNSLIGFSGTGLELNSLSNNFVTINQAIGATVQPVLSYSNTVTGSITSGIGLDVSNSTLTTATLTGQAGVRIQALSGATNNTALLIGQTAIPTGSFGIYNASANANYFAGNVGIGTTTPGSALSVTGNAYLSGFYNTSQTTGGYKMSGSVVLTASSTSGLTLGGIGAGSALSATTTLNGNTVFGFNAANVSTSTNQTTAIGYRALASLNDCRNAGTGGSGCLLTAVGYNALAANTTGYWNTALGAAALQTNTTGTQNVGLGAGALNLNTTGSGNVAIGGTGALAANVSGSSNVAIGQQSLTTNTGSNNTGVGTYAGFYNTSGSTNTFMGKEAGMGNVSVTNDSNSVIDTNMLFLGYRAAKDRYGLASTSVMTNSAAIGANAVVGASNAIALGGLGSNAVRVGIGSSTPFAKLSLHAYNGETNINLFAIGSSTASATTTHFTVKNDGKVYAPNTTSSGSAQTGYWCYDADGQFVRTSTTCLVSASRFKEHVGDLDVGLAELMKLRPVSYFLKDTMGDPNNSDQQIGFIAEEAQAVDARLVTRNSEGQVQSFRYEQFTALLTKAIQEQQRQIENLKVGVVEIKRSVEEDWQNFFLLLLFAGLIFQQVQINKLRK